MKLHLSIGEPAIPPRISRWAKKVAVYRQRVDEVELEASELEYARDLAERNGVTLERAVMHMKTSIAGSSMEETTRSVFTQPRELEEPADDTNDETVTVEVEQ